MRALESLSDLAKRIIDDATERSVSVRELIGVYECWRSDDHPTAVSASVPNVPDDLIAIVRERLGLTRETSEEFEALGDAISALVKGAEQDVAQRWHQAKLVALESGDRDKKRIALRHLDSRDYDDELVIAALIESLSRDDEQVALLFSVTAGTQIDPSCREDVVLMLHDELRRYERRHSSRAAFFGSAIEQMYQNYPHAVPFSWLLESLVKTVTASDDPVSYAATVDICALAIHRSRDVTLIEQ
jgi:hypothetical protein